MTESGGAGGVVGSLHRRGAAISTWWVGASKPQLLVVGLPVLLYAFVAWEHRYTIEDGFVYYRIAENLAAGEGPVFNVGERVEVFTGPLWVGLLGTLRFVLGDVIGPGSQAAIAGVACATAALGLGTAGSMKLTRLGAVATDAADGSAMLLPVGSLVVVGSPVMWYYATSGLETAMSFLWLAACFWILATRAADAAGGTTPRVDRPRWQLVVLGLGWIVRPELLLASVVFVALALVAGAGGWRARLRGLAWSLAVPASYEIFRMGYFASLVPNTALAKSASRARWSQGFAYLQDFVSYDKLLIPLVVALAVTAWTVWRCRGRGPVVLATLLAFPLVGFLHGLYVVRIGGDVVHARFLVVPYFALLLPSFTVALGGWSTARAKVTTVTGAAAALVVVAWAVPTGAKWGFLRSETVYTEYRFGQLSHDQTPNPLEVTDFWEPDSPFTTVPAAARAAALAGHDSLFNFATLGYLTGQVQVLDLVPGSGVVFVTWSIGMESVRVGNDVYVHDAQSLADPIGARLDLGDPGETEGSIVQSIEDPRLGKNMPQPWIFAHYQRADGVMDEQTALAATALSCGQIDDLLWAVGGPLDVGGFFDNLWHAAGYTTMSIPADPAAAVAEYC